MSELYNIIAFRGEVADGHSVDIELELGKRSADDLMYGLLQANSLGWKSTKTDRKPIVALARMSPYQKRTLPNFNTRAAKR